MATKLYLRNSAYGGSGTLPSTEQSTLTANYGATQTTNKTLNRTKGTSQTSISVAIPTSLATVSCYICKFISDPISQSGIASNTWTINLGVQANPKDTTAQYPVNSSGTAGFYTCMYVWRPSTGAKVANIVDTFTTQGSAFTNTNQHVIHGTVSGSAVASATTNDVIIFEFWIPGRTANSSMTLHGYWDGSTETTTHGNTVSDHASFISTPEDIVFVGDAPPSLTMTNASTKILTNKFITKV